MLTQILLGAGLDPTAVIGGKLPAIGGNGRVGESGVMVCEACEFNDHFLQLDPDVAVILNVDADHLEYCLLYTSKSPAAAGPCRRAR